MHVLTLVLFHPFPISGVGWGVGIPSPHRVCRVFLLRPEHLGNCETTSYLNLVLAVLYRTHTSRGMWTLTVYTKWGWQPRTVVDEMERGA